MTHIIMLASRQHKKTVEQFWKHLVMLRRQARGVAWVEPLYVEDLSEENAIVARIPEKYIVLACLGSDCLAGIMGDPAINEIVYNASLKVPIKFERCGWDQYPSPFATLQALPYGSNTQIVGANANNHLVDVVGAIRQVIAKLQVQ